MVKRICPSVAKTPAAAMMRRGTGAGGSQAQTSGTAETTVPMALK